MADANRNPGHQNLNLNRPEIRTLMVNLREGLSNVGRMSPNWSIYRVPKRLRQVNPDAYAPHIISIGPLHYGEPALADLEEHKRRYMVSLLRRLGARDLFTEDGPLMSCAQAILNMEREVREWYFATINLNPVELAAVLLLDGCFVLELLFRYSEKQASKMVKNDGVFQSSWMMSTLRRDLALLENQIPFFVLKRLFYLVVEHEPSLRADYLPIMAYNFFRPDLSSSANPMPLMGGEIEFNHLLDLLLKCHLPWPPTRSRPTDEETRRRRRIMMTSGGAHGHGSLRNIASLVEVGAVVKKAQTAGSLFDFKFSNGVLEIPPLHIHEWTDSLFRNLIAYEHCCPDSDGNITGQCMVSYIVLMDRLIDKKEDVEVLEREGIITVELGGSEDVTNFFKDICKQVTVKELYFEELFEDVGKYYRSRWRGYWRDVREQYLKNPTTFFSWVGAVIVVIATILQTIFTILGFIHDTRSSS